MNKADFDVHFDLAIKSRTQTKFEEWFSEMAAAVYGTDFEAIKAGGVHGDKKSDGRRISTDTVFQCYAPESPQTFAANASAKIQDSFPEVIAYWPNLKEWVFVHNNVEGMPTSVSDKIEEVRSHHPGIKILAPQPRRFLKDKFHDKLTLQQLIDIYPSASLDFSSVTMKDIQPLLKKVVRERDTVTDNGVFGDIPDQAKLDYNGLSADAKFDIKRARAHVDIVDRYLAGMNRPDQVSTIQAQIRNKYEELSDLGYEPDEIVAKMLESFGSDGTPQIRAAAYVILAYYFDACDIFENLPNDAPC